jgi:hypothetical protein
MEWEIEVTDQFLEWWQSDLSTDEQAAVDVAIEALQQRGPSLPRPLSDTVKGSAYNHMKELRPPSTNIRVLYAFDPRRCAIMLVGGDKTGAWSSWYRTNIPIADELYAVHLDTLRREGSLP